ncbi:lysis protein [Xenorhabdus lircayensis]|uniref:Lysis protein n=1 Tax=Xenorhabdus lircayensis TaxID=2763499 RepID=A0ABS0U3Z9_9GAMM|nr:lysis protein [Xenorhabdus lircayensis]MBI6548615.1 lysis protein [Xenorhabdus lircayensis]
MNTLTKTLAATCAILAFGLWWVNDSYSDLKSGYGSLLSDFNKQTALITNQQERIQHLAELDTRHTQELTNAKSKITQLSDDLRTNVKRVYVKAQCPVSETASSTGLDDSRPARLEKDAEQDYVRLLGELETLEAQYVGLRDYVNSECHKVNK